MTGLDPRTLIVVASVTAATMAGALWWVLGRRLETGVTLWVLSLALTALGTGLIAAAGALPDGRLLALRTAFFALSYGLRYVALALFFGIPYRRSLLYGPVLAEVAVVAALPGDPVTAIAVVDLLRLFQNLLCLAVVVRHGEPRADRAQGLMVFGLGLIAAVFAVRGIPALADPTWGPVLSANGLLATLTWLAAFSGTTLTSLALVLMYLNRTSTELVRTNAVLAAASRTDPLTGIANRRFFNEALDEEWRRARRAGTPLAAVMIDVDHFKDYNDTYGHNAGDDCLRTITRHLTAHLRRPADLAARFGGEEFVLLLPATDLKGARGVAETIRAAIEALPWPALAGQAAVTVSAGVAALVPDGHTGHGDLIAAADRALYSAKRAGRNRVAEADVPDAGLAEPLRLPRDEPPWRAPDRSAPRPYQAT